MNEAQRDGRACVVCGRDNLPLVPVGFLYGVQVFSCCEVPPRIAKAGRGRGQGPCQAGLMTPEEIPPGWKRYVCTGCGSAEVSPMHEPGGWGWGRDGGLLCPPHAREEREKLYARVRGDYDGAAKRSGLTRAG